MKSLTLIVFVMTTSLCIAQDMTLVPFESMWKYLDNGSNQGIAWRQSSFDDSSWSEGPALLGFGVGDVNTTVSFGLDPENKHITTYFRHHFWIEDTSVFLNYLLKLRKDDAAIVYINDQEIMRSNFGISNYTYLSEAYTLISSEEEDIIWQDLISPAYFQNGENVIAVEVHQYGPTSSDLIFDLELQGLDSSPSLYRLPYLQKASQDGVTVKWKTDIPTDSKVSYGQNEDLLTLVQTSSDLTVDHEVTITGLEPATDYYYTVGTISEDLTAASPDCYFSTLPEAGTSTPTRIWVTGDAGTGKDEQIDVRDAYLNYIGTAGKSDLWLMMGDNAYEFGREADYHMGLFSVYQDVLRNTVCYSTTGNHDLLGEASATTETGAYYDIFALPSEGESGGIPSGKESYYSIDYGNIHIVSLESYELDRDSTGEMANWLIEDLENTSADWLIAFWHFAPYTKVGHDSDDPTDWSGRAIDMRENFNPILESFGVDLILSGHSHGYERSYLIDGHYGLSGTLTSDMIVDESSGDLSTTGAYMKPEGLPPNQGAVYAVCGSSGKLTSLLADGPHPVMYTSNTDFAGSMIIDVVGNTLEGKFLNEQGLIQDYFHIVKDGISSTGELNGPRIFDVYPNPASGNVTIKFSKAIDIAGSMLRVYSSLGSLVREFDLGSSDERYSMNIPLNGIAEGLYTLKFYSKKDELVYSSLLLIE